MKNDKISSAGRPIIGLSFLNGQLYQKHPTGSQFFFTEACFWYLCVVVLFAGLVYRADILLLSLLREFISVPCTALWTSCRCLVAHTQQIRLLSQVRTLIQSGGVRKRGGSGREGGKGGGGWKRKRDSVLFPLSCVVYFSFKGWFHGLAHVQAITSGHSISFFKEKLRACESFPVKILWSVEKNAAMDVISLIGAPLTCLPFTTQFHSLWANQVRMINSACNTNCENSCLNPLTFSVKSGHQSFCVQGDLHLFKT